MDTLVSFALTRYPTHPDGGDEPSTVINAIRIRMSDWYVTMEAGGDQWSCYMRQTDDGAWEERADRPLVMHD